MFPITEYLKLIRNKIIPRICLIDSDKQKIYIYKSYSHSYIQLIIVIDNNIVNYSYIKVIEPVLNQRESLNQIENLVILMHIEKRWAVIISRTKLPCSTIKKIVQYFQS